MTGTTDIILFGLTLSTQNMNKTNNHTQEFLQDEKQNSHNCLQQTIEQFRRIQQYVK